MSTFVLKMLAVLFMFIDHIYMYFFAPSEGASLILTCIGRLAYPLFLFCMVWGYQYTRNRKVYLLRLYLGSLFMTAFSYPLNHFILPEWGYGFHNIFLSMFLVGVVISTIEILGDNFPDDAKERAEYYSGIEGLDKNSNAPVIVPPKQQVPIRINGRYN